MDAALNVDFVALGGPCRICLEGAPGAAMEAAVRAAMAEIQRIEAKFSRYRSDSVVSRINRGAGGGPLAIDEETASLLGFGEQLWAASEGRFDLTSGALRRVWDFQKGIPPSPEALAACLTRVGWSRVTWAPPIGGDAGWILLPHQGMELDLGGIGKEYATDRAAAILLEQGMIHGLVNLGGDIHAIGPRGLGDCAGRSWDIEIQHPRPALGMAALAHLDLGRGGLATSGDYERYFIHGGKRYCHILDARSGWPVEYWQSVSVLAPTTTAAGALATLAMLLGEGARAWLSGQGVGWLGAWAGGVERVNPPVTP